MADYTVKSADDFETYPGAAGQHGPLSGSLLMRINDSGRSEGLYRVVATGDGDLKHTFSAAAISTAERVAHYDLFIETAPDELRFKPNSTVTKWEDLDDLVAGERIRAGLDDDQDADDDFRAAWAAARADGDHAAAAIRWSVQGHQVRGLELVLQALPCTAREARSDARLANAGSRTIELARWTLATPMQTEGRSRGPIPILFADDPDSATEALRIHPDRLQKGSKYSLAHVYSIC